MTNLIVVDTVAGIEEMRAHIQEPVNVAFDQETTGLTKHDTVVGMSIATSTETAYYAILAEWNPTLQTLIVHQDRVDAAKVLLKDLTTKQLIMHNGVFDCMMAEAYFKVRLIEALHTDTLVLAQLLNENRKNGLKELARAYFGDDSTNEQKEMKKSVLANGGVWSDAKGGVKEMYKADAYLLGRYGAQDALLTFKLFEELVLELFDQGLENFFYDEESMPMLRTATYDLNTIGLKVDTQALIALRKTLEAECLEHKAFIYKEIEEKIKDKYPGTSKKTTFNIGSSSQLAWLLFGVMELDYKTLTKGGKEVCKALVGKLPYYPAARKAFITACNEAKGQVYAPEATVSGKKVKAKKVRDPWSYIACDKKTLTIYAPKYKFIAALLDYHRKTKLLNTYVIGIQDRLEYGLIQPSFLQHGTTSGRYASRNPNFQNLPRDDKRIKHCIRARPGKCLVGADYSQLEPRVFAYYSGDERLKAAFNGTDDFYSVAGIEIWDLHDALPIKEGDPNAFGVKYKAYRDRAKVIMLATTYGTTAHNLAQTTGKSTEETQEDMDRIFEKFPGVKTFQAESHKLAKTEGVVTNLFGRKRRIPEAMKLDKIYKGAPHAELPYDARKLLNLAVNHRIQSTGASIVNRAMVRFYQLCQEADIKAPLVLQVHDSLIAECDEADGPNVLILLQEAMENSTTLPGVPLEAIPKIGQTVAEV